MKINFKYVRETYEILNNFQSYLGGSDEVLHSNRRKIRRMVNPVESKLKKLDFQHITDWCTQILEHDEELLGEEIWKTFNEFFDMYEKVCGSFLSRGIDHKEVVKVLVDLTLSELIYLDGLYIDEVIS